MVDKSALMSVIEFLTSKEKRRLASDLLDVYFRDAKCLNDFDAIGAAAMETKYTSMYLRCAEICYGLARTNQEIVLARENLINAYNFTNQPEKALLYIDLQQQAKPDDFDTQCLKIASLSLMGKRAECEELVQRLFANNPHEKENKEFLLSSIYLRQGRTAKGLMHWLNNFKPKHKIFNDMLKFHHWTGGAYPGRTIISVGEGGIGDELINLRFFDYLRDLFMNPILYATWDEYRSDVTELIRRHGYQVEKNYLFFPKDSLWCYHMNIPAHLGLNESQLWRQPYLFAQRNPKNKLNETGLKIGIKVQGNPYFEQDHYRSIPIDQMLAALPENANIYYIDKAQSYQGCIDLSNRIQTWEDTLDFIDQMDIIVSSCTSLPHVAGAMGKTTIVLTPILEYYIWTSTRKDTSSVWYRSNFFNFKQTSIGSWIEPLQQVKNFFLSGEYQKWI